MWATASSRANALDAGWAVFAVASSAAMPLVGDWVTVPFHFVWVSLAVVYGWRAWSLRRTLLVLVAVQVVTGTILGHAAAAGEIEWAETLEVPLMTALFLAMVWHVRRRAAALDEVRRLATLESQRHETQQRFIRLASHELRTPITVARGYTELLRAERPDPCVLDSTAVVLDELSALANISGRLLALAQGDGVGAGRNGGDSALGDPHPIEGEPTSSTLDRRSAADEPVAPLEA